MLRAVALCGSMSALGRLLSVTPQAVQLWCQTRVPMSRCREIEEVTLGAVQCEELREDYNLLEVRPYRRQRCDAVYVSGPMTGLPDLNFPAFHAEASRLRAAGFRVVNPAEIVLPPDATWAQFLRADLIQMLMHCNTVSRLPGWDKSRGAMLELHIALSLNMTIIEAGA